MDTMSHLTSALDGRYTLEREIGRGGMATVYLARDVRHQRQVALKVLDPELGAVLGGERFLSEIRVTANLQHPNLLPLFDSGEANGLLFYVMPFVEGETLRARLDRDKQLPIDEAVRIAVAVANAVQYAHTHGVIHRDLKPENILLHAGQPVVADFGIALAVSNAGGNRITQTGLSLGTPQYMSPEQATGDRTVDGRSDIYSLGAVTYEMLTGEPPHTGNTAQAIIAKLMTDDVRPLTLLRRTVPPHVDSAVRHALERLPADRPATAHEFAEALQGRASAATMSQPAAVRRGERRTIASRLRDPVALVLAALLVVAVTVPRVGRSPGKLTVSSLLPPQDLDFSEAASFGTLAPDGRRFAFVTLGARGETKLWIRRLDTLGATPLVGTEGARVPFWSPDGKSVGYFLGDSLFISDVIGSAPRLLCAVPQALGADWGGGNVIVIATTSGIFQGSPGNTSCVRRIKLEGEVASYRHPSLMHDGRHVLFSVHSHVAQILAGDLETGHIQIVLDQAIDPTIIGSTLVYGEIGTEGKTKLLAQRFDAKTLRVTGSAVPIAGPVRASEGIYAYSVRENALVFLPGLGDNGEILTDRLGRPIDTIRAAGIWMHARAREHQWIAHTSGDAMGKFDIATHTENPIGEGRNAPVWSPHDSILAAEECARPRCSVGGTRLSDGHHVVLAALDSGVLIWPSSLSADVRYIVGTRMREFTAHSTQIWLIDVAAHKATPLLTPSYAVLEPSISPDGRWLAYRSQETGHDEVVVRPFLRDGPAQRISLTGGRLPYWRADGRELLFQDPDGRVMSVDVQLQPSLTLGNPHALFTAPSWTRHLFFDIGTSYGMSADAQQFTARMTATSATAVLVQNWQALLP